MPRHSATIAAWAALCAGLTSLLLAGCAKDKPSPAPKPATASAPEAAAEPAPPPKPVDIGMDEKKYVQAATLERCARAGGETAADSRTVAIDLIAGRPFQPVTPEAVAAAVKKVKAAAALPTGGTATDKDAPAEGTEEAARTPAGRWASAPSDAAHVGRYERANTLLSKRPDLSKRIAEGVRDCVYAPELGRVERELIDRYVATFVDITCAAERLRDDKGKTDEVAHAHEAARLFSEKGFKAAEFARLGVIFGRFPAIEKAMYDGRRKNCPDPREIAAKKAVNGAYLGSFDGTRSGTLTLTAEDGSLTGTIVFAPVGKAKADKPAKADIWPVRGAISDSHVHLLATRELEFVRLEARMAKEGYAGRWQAELDFKKLSGRWQMKRPPPPKPKVDSPTPTAAKAPAVAPAAAPAPAK